MSPEIDARDSDNHDLESLQPNSTRAVQSICAPLHNRYAAQVMSNNAMAILKIARMGHPVLRQRACEVADPFSDEIAVLVEDMIETMYDANGRGLAAPQVHVPLRVVVFYPGDGDELVTLVNPTVELLTDERVESWEGCLSVPGLRGLVPRAPAVRYTGVTPRGQHVDRTVDGFHAVVVQHEFDHLDGILYPQRMRDLNNLIFESEARWIGSDDEENDT